MSATHSPQGGSTPVAAIPHEAAGVTPACTGPSCDWCGDLGLVQVAELIGDRAVWAAGLLVLCVCVESGRAA